MTYSSPIILVTGGARSGKSALAERLVANLQPKGTEAIYIATAQALDTEMEARIDLHQQRRTQGWRTIEQPYDLVAALAASDGQGVRLIDCLTLWLANMQGKADVAGLCHALGRQSSPVVLVTNELGLGIVPADAMTRRFRDDHGWMNQAVAEVADQVWMSVSGLPLRLKPQDYAL